MDFGGFDSSIILIQRGGILMSIGGFPESLSQAMLVGCNVSRRTVRITCYTLSILWGFKGSAAKGQFRKCCLTVVFQIMPARVRIAWATLHYICIYIYIYTCVCSTYTYNTYVHIHIYIYIFIIFVYIAEHLWSNHKLMIWISKGLTQGYS